MKKVELAPVIPPAGDWYKNFSQITKEAEVGKEIVGGKLCKVDMVNPTDKWLWMIGVVKDRDTGAEVTKNPLMGHHYMSPKASFSADFPPWPSVIKMPDKDWRLVLKINEWWFP